MEQVVEGLTILGYTLVELATCRINYHKHVKSACAFAQFSRYSDTLYMGRGIDWTGRRRVNNSWAHRGNYRRLVSYSHTCQFSMLLTENCNVFRM